MKLGVIIITYNRLELLKQCIEACLKQTVGFSKIIVINNASTDGTADYLRKINNKKLHVVNSDINTGGAGGFYLGVKEAMTYDLDYLLFIDDDAIIDVDFNKTVLPFIEKDGSNIFAYSGTVKTDGRIQFEHRRHMKKNFKCYDSKAEEYSGNYFDYDLASFCGLYASMDIIKKIGLPRRDFFIWFDDTEYSVRINKFTKIRNINKAIINHKTKIMEGGGYTWKSYYSIRNRLVILNNYFSKATLIRAIANIRLHIIYSRILGIIKRDSYYKSVSRMYSDALKDAKNNNLGKNGKYFANNDDFRKRKK